jgi:hypothetical protein
MFITFATLTHLSEFLQKSTKLMFSSSNFHLLLFVFLKLSNSLNLVT